MPCPGQSQSRQFSTSRSIVVFTQPTSPNRTHCHIVLFRVIRLEATCPCVLLVTPGKGVGVGNASVGKTLKGSVALIGSKHVRLFMIPSPPLSLGARLSPSGGKHVVPPPRERPQS